MLLKEDNLSDMFRHKFLGQEFKNYTIKKKKNIIKFKVAPHPKILFQKWKNKSQAGKNGVVEHIPDKVFVSRIKIYCTTQNNKKKKR